MQDARGCLLELQKLASSDTEADRADTLSCVTDLFFMTSDEQDESVTAVFGEVMERLAYQLEAAARVKLAERLADSRDAPHGLVCRLADDEIGVARPVLENSSCLDDADLVEIAKTRGQDHLLAISNRETLSTVVTDIVVERGDEEVLENVAKNQGAAFSRKGMGQLAHRANDNPDLYAVLELRTDLPEDILAELKQTVAHRLKQEIADIPISISGAELDAIIEAKAAQMNLLSPGEMDEIGDDGAGGSQVTESMVVAFARTRKLTEAIQSLSLISGLSFKRVAHCLLSADLTALAVLCKANGFANTTFAALMQARSASNPSPVRVVAEAMRRYDMLDAETAQRAIETVQLKEARNECS